MKVHALTTPATVDLPGGLKLKVARTVTSAKSLAWWMTKERLDAELKRELLELRASFAKDVWPGIYPAKEKLRDAHGHEQEIERPPSYATPNFVAGADALFREIIEATALELEGVEVEGLDMAKPKDIVTAIDRVLGAVGLPTAALAALAAQSPTTEETFSSGSS